MRIAAMLALLLLTACISIPEKNLDWLLSEFNAIDAKYNGSWHQERIPDKLMPAAGIQRAFFELQLLKKQVNSTLQDLIQARLDMLSSQLLYQQAVQLGPRAHIDWEIKGKAIIVKESIDCKDVLYIKKATALYNSSLSHAISAFNALDRVLQSSEEARQKIGVNEKRPRFYTSRLGQIAITIDVHNSELRKC